MDLLMEEIKEKTDENEYVSIAKFAEMAGITKQAVYQRLNKDLLNYVKVDGKVKKVSTAALSLFAVKLNAKEQPIESPIEQVIEQDNVQVEQDNLKLIEYLRAENERLKQQINEKDEIIAKKDEIIVGYADRFATLAERAQELTNNAQHLHAIAEAQKSNEEIISTPVSVGTIEKKKPFLGIFKRKEK